MYALRSSTSRLLALWVTDRQTDGGGQIYLSAPAATTTTTPIGFEVYLVSSTLLAYTTTIVLHT